MVCCPLIRRPVPALFRTALQRTHQRFRIYAATSPQPLPAAGLVITPEIRLQSELYLPMTELRRLFYRLYQETLCYPPILSSSPLYSSPSWIDCFGGLPGWLQLSPNPAVLVERLLADAGLLTRFIFFSFLPERFNGAGFGRYPQQLDWLRTWLCTKARKNLRILDAACGDGTGAWELAALLANLGRRPEQLQIEGWTREPLEVWAAQNRCLPHLPERSNAYQQQLQPLTAAGWGRQINFRSVDLLDAPLIVTPFDLILCNGLLGGPIINSNQCLQQVISNLTSLLAPDGVLLMADHFHGGWRKKVPVTQLARIVAEQGLRVSRTAGGLVAAHPLQCN